MAGLSLLVKRLSEFAILPTRGSAGAAGYDLSAAYDGEVPARGKALLKTDLAIVVPSGTYGRVGEGPFQSKCDHALMIMRISLM